MLLGFGIDLTTKKDYQGLQLRCSLKNNILCPSHSLSAPALSWDPMLSKKVEIELILDAHMYLFFEKGMRGGVSYISRIFEFCCCHSNHKYLHSYDPKQESEHIIYLDAKNVYGDGKFQPMDYALAPDEIESKKEMSIYQLTIAEFCNIPIGNVKKLDKRKICASSRKLETRIRTKKSTSHIKIQSVTVAKIVCQM